MSDFISDWAANVERLRDTYDASQEHDACGVGLVAALDGRPRRDVVEAGVAALKAIWHRGAVDADGKTGDGAGIHVEIPREFFADEIARFGESIEGGIAVGQVFLPKTDYAAQERCRQIVETEILEFGYTIYGWRQVPINTEVIGEKANATRPEIEQIIIRNALASPDDVFERDLYVIRRRIENAVIAAQIGEFYICSLSCRSIIYKGMFLAEHLVDFYPDIADPRFVSRFAIYHQRYSTNTFPTWKLAQPFRMVAHNGEINTLSGNVNWMRSHETRLAAVTLDPYLADIKPVVQAGNSDTASFDNVFELLVRGGRDAPMAKMLMVPPSMGVSRSVPAAQAAMVQYCNGVMEPWDGPAAIAATDGRWVIAGLDRNGLRPLRYTLSADNLLIVGSETGMVKVADADVVARGRLGPGQTIGVDLETGAFHGAAALKDMLAARHDFAGWTSRTRQIDNIVRGEVVERIAFAGEVLRRRQLAVGATLEELEMILHPMVADAAEATGSMGDDTPIAVLSERYRGLHHYFRQAFSQVTNPPIDSLRETQVMTIKTRLGNLGNILEEEDRQCDMLALDSPVLSNAEFAALVDFLGDRAVAIDCTFDAQEGTSGLRVGIERIRREAEEHVRAGGTHVMLTDEHQSAERAMIPMILATAAVHTHLVRQSLRDVCVAQCPFGRMSRRARLRGADRRGCDDRQRLPGPGEHRRSSPARAVRRHVVAHRGRALPKGRRQGPAEGHVEDGHLGARVVSGRLQLRGDRVVACSGRRVLSRHGQPDLGHRAAGDRA